ncbi:hypothetical protein Mapa_013689 [Marchantia paleacea]|nr:hypothetical protein Mapa_013684 [Marchantia paleacea]KAG6544997.1 hypothetical protein Mapa_013689 [Marchantia paleacea]
METVEKIIVSVPLVTVNVLMLLLRFSSFVEASVTIAGYPTSGRCRQGNTFVCNNVAEDNCCDFVQNNGPVLSILFSSIRPGQYMSSWNVGAQGNSGCEERVELRQHTHGAPKSRRCLSNNGLTMSGGKWHRRQPANEFGLDPHFAASKNCSRVIKARLMTWNSTLEDYVDVHD